MSASSSAWTELRTPDRGSQRTTADHPPGPRQVILPPRSTSTTECLRWAIRGRSAASTVCAQQQIVGGALTRDHPGDATGATSLPARDSVAIHGQIVVSSAGCMASTTDALGAVPSISWSGPGWDWRCTTGKAWRSIRGRHPNSLAKVQRPRPCAPVDIRMVRVRPRAPIWPSGGGPFECAMIGGAQTTARLPGHRERVVRHTGCPTRGHHNRSARTAAWHGYVSVVVLAS